MSSSDDPIQHDETEGREQMEAEFGDSEGSDSTIATEQVEFPQASPTGSGDGKTLEALWTDTQIRRIEDSQKKENDAQTAQILSKQQEFEQAIKIGKWFLVTVAGVIVTLLIYGGTQMNSDIKQNGSELKGFYEKLSGTNEKLADINASTRIAASASEETQRQNGKLEIAISGMKADYEDLKGKFDANAESIENIDEKLAAVDRELNLKLSALSHQVLARRQVLFSTYVLRPWRNSEERRGGKHYTFVFDEKDLAFIYDESKGKPLDVERVSLTANARADEALLNGSASGEMSNGGTELKVHVWTTTPIVLEKLVVDGRVSVNVSFLAEDVAQNDQ